MYIGRVKIYLEVLDYYGRKKERFGSAASVLIGAAF
jgi:hypothetical protein